MRALIGILLLAVAPGMAETGRSIPLFFFPNVFADLLPNGGQANPSIRFIAETPEFRAAFRADSVTVQIHGSPIRIRFAESNADVAMEGSELLPGTANFLIGNSPRNWKQGIPTYHKILYRGLYPGVDLTYSAFGPRLKSEFTVAPGADPGRILLEYEGADRVSIDLSGRLVVTAGPMEMREEAPAIYQESAHGRVPVEGRYRLAGPLKVGFEIGNYDPSRPLVIDPVISYCTYLGGSAMGAVTSVAVDGAGNVYAAGWTEALNFPIAGAVQAENRGGVDAFVAKLNVAGTAFDYATYIGGQGDDRAAGIAVDSLGQAYVAGSTSSTNFPLVSPLQSKLAGGRTAFALKLNPAGSSLVYSTYLGGSNYDLGNAIAVDGSGNAYIAGDTMSADFPVLHAAQSTLGGETNAFVTKLTPAGAISFSTFLGGAGSDHAGGIAVDGSGNSYVAGGTFSANFPIVGAIQATNAGGQNAFITKIDAAGSAFVYSTYLGGSGGNSAAPEQANAIAVDASGNAYVAGVTNSTNFPVTSGAFQTSYDGATDAFVAKINAPGNALVYSSYLGGSSFDWASGIAADGSGNAYVAGYTSSFDFPAIGGVQPGFNGFYDAFVTTINAAGSTLTFSTYYGGTGADTANAIAIDSFGGIYTGGQTSSNNLGLVSPVQSVNYGGSIGWLMRMGPPPPPEVASVTPSSGSGNTQVFSFVYLDADGPADLAQAQVLINTAVGGAGACYVFYNPALNSVTLANNAYTSLLGPITLGTANTLQNSQCTVNGAASSATWLGNTLTLKLSLTFAPAFDGAKYIYGYARSVGGLVSGFQALGVWTVIPPSAPQVVSVSPSSGSGSSQVFSFVYLDANGAADLAQAQVLINTAVGGAGACYVFYNPVLNSVTLGNNTYTSLLGPMTLGTANTLQNSQCTVNGATSSATWSGNTLTLNLSLTLEQAFAGPKYIFGYAITVGGLVSGWQTLGVWTVPGVSPAQVVSVSPSSGSGSAQVFSFVYLDPNGEADLAQAQVLINTAVGGVGACYVFYNPALNSVTLGNNAYTSLLGPMTLGTATTLQNSQCIVNGATSSASWSGNTLTLKLSLTMESAFAGPKYIFGYAITGGGLVSGWQTLGVWTVPGTAPPPPQVVSVSPSSGGGTAEVFSFVYIDPSGEADLAQAQVLINTAVGGAGACYVFYNPALNSVTLGNDAYTSLLGPMTLGASATLQNSQCVVNGASSSAAWSGDDLILKLSLTFEPAFAGAKYIFGYAFTVGGLVSGWQTLGVWTVP
jgi:Beta-propeller repeat